MDSSALYETGDEKTTTQYCPWHARAAGIAPGFCDDRPLCTAVLTLSTRSSWNGYAIQAPEARATARQSGRGGQGTLPLAPAIRARPNLTALLLRDTELRYRANAYQKAIASGFTNKVWLAELTTNWAWHGKEGTARKGQDGDASVVAIRPNTRNSE